MDDNEPSAVDQLTNPDDENDDEDHARRVRWRVWAVEHAQEVYRYAQYDQFYINDFMAFADRLFRWVALLDDTAVGEQDDEDQEDKKEPLGDCSLTPASMDEAMVSRLAILKYREKKADEAKARFDGFGPKDAAD